MHRGRLQEMLINATIGKLRTQWLDQAGIPAGMHHTKIARINKQR